jgi:hypothetical protein
MGTSKSVNQVALARRRHLRKVVRWTVGSVLGVITVGLLMYWLVSSSWFIIWRARPVLARQLGGPVEIGSAQYDGRGTFVLQDVRVQAPGLRGLARDVLTVGQVVVSTDFERLLTGRIRADDLELSGVTLRLSEAADESGNFNFMGLRPTPRTDGEPPRVRIYDAMVEVGVHRGSEFQLIGQRMFSGSMTATSDDPHLFNVTLFEIDQDHRTVPQGVSLQGRWNSRTLEHSATVRGLMLDRGTYEMCPAAVRFWWDRLDLQGRVHEARMSMVPAEMKLTAELKVENVAMTLPIDGAGVWARYSAGTVEPTSGRPRMHVREGVVRIENTTLVMDDLQGELISTDGGAAVAAVPYHVSLQLQAPGDLHDLAKLDAGEGKPWIEGVLETTAIDMTVVAEPFVLLSDADGPAQTVALPEPLAKVLKRFNPTRCTLGTEIRVQRPAASRDDEGRPIVEPIRLSGRATIREAQGSFFKFPYLLENVQADLEFDNDQIRIIQLTGDGSEGAVVRVTGLVWPPGDDPAVQLRLQATDLPLDERLYAALPADSKPTFDALLAEQAFNARREAGLIVDAAAIEAARSERQDLMRRLDEASRGRAAGEIVEAAATDQLMQRVARLDRMVDVGAFEFGGRVDLDLELNRPAGKGKRTVITGRVDARSVGLLHHQFQYPLQILSGRFDWRDDRIVIVADEHGDGLRLATPGGGMGMVTGEIRLERSESDTRAIPDLHVTVQGDHVNELLYYAIPNLQDIDSGGRGAAGAARSPARSPARSLRGNLFAIDAEDQQDELTLSRGGALLKSLQLSALVDCEGVIRSDAEGNPDFDFLLTLRDGRVDPSEAVARIADNRRLSWPRGLQLEDVEGQLHVTPQRLEVVRLGGRRGEGRVDATGALDLRSGKLAAASELRFVRFALEPCLFDMASPDDVAALQALWERHDPRSVFDAVARFDPDDPGASATLVIEPHQFSCVLDGQVIALQRQDGVIRFDERGFHLDGLRMRLADDVDPSAAAEPRDFELDGLVSIDQGLQADLAIKHNDGKLSPQLRAILPEPVRRTLEAIEFSCGALDVMDNSRLRVRRRSEAGEPTQWESGFAGTIRVRDARFNAGLSFSGVDALMEIVGHGGSAPVLEIAGRAGRAVTAGREMRDVDFSLHLDEAAQTVELAEFRGDLSGGAVTATASIGVGENRDYQLDVSLVGVGLDGLARPVDADGVAPGPEAGGAPPTGKVFGRIAMAGTRGEPEGRRGGGSVRIVDANIPVEPITMSLLQLMDFMPPIAPSFGYLDADFYIKGDHATFEQLEIASPTLRLAGQGGMNVDTLALDLRFRVRGSVLLVSDLLSILSDQIYEIAVSGPLNDPQARLVGLPAFNPHESSDRPTVEGRSPDITGQMTTEPTE